MEKPRDSLTARLEEEPQRNMGQSSSLSKISSRSGFLGASVTSSLRRSCCPTRRRRLRLPRPRCADDVADALDRSHHRHHHQRRGTLMIRVESRHARSRPKKAGTRGGEDSKGVQRSIGAQRGAAEQRLVATLADTGSLRRTATRRRWTLQLRTVTAAAASVHDASADARTSCMRPSTGATLQRAAISRQGGPKAHWRSLQKANAEEQNGDRPVREKSSESRARRRFGSPELDRILA